MRFHWPTTISTGAKARPIMIEEAIITPGEISCSMASQAPPPIMAICTSMRTNFVRRDRDGDQQREHAEPADRLAVLQCGCSEL